LTEEERILFVQHPYRKLDVLRSAWKDDPLFCLFLGIFLSLDIVILCVVVRGIVVSVVWPSLVLLPIVVLLSLMAVFIPWLISKKRTSSYQLITNHRVALVRPCSFWSTTWVESAIYQNNLDLLINAELSLRGVLQDHLVRVVHNKDNCNAGEISLQTPRCNFRFLLEDNIEMVENMLTGIIQEIVAKRNFQHPKFELKRMETCNSARSYDSVKFVKQQKWVFAIITVIISAVMLGRAIWLFLQKANLLSLLAFALSPLFFIWMTMMIGKIISKQWEDQFGCVAEQRSFLIAYLPSQQSNTV